jgi:hypothetical protein
MVKEFKRSMPKAANATTLVPFDRFLPPLKKTPDQHPQRTNHHSAIGDENDVVALKPGFGIAIGILNHSMESQPFTSL